MRTFRLKRTKKADETYPLRLTQHQRESMVHATRIKNKVKERLQAAGAGTQVVGFTYQSWSYKQGKLRVEFRNKAGLTFEWRVLPMTGSCAAGSRQSFQLGGNKVWWARDATEQFAWRCVFDLAGKPLRLEAASSAPMNKLAPAGLGIVAAHAKRY